MNDSPSPRPPADSLDGRPDALSEDGRFLGYPDAALGGTWTVQDLCGFLRVSERKARALMKTPGAPRPLRTGSARCDRWNPYEVVAWLHGATPDAPQRSSATLGRAAAQAAAPPDAGRLEAPPGRAWTPAAAR